MRKVVAVNVELRAEGQGASTQFRLALMPRCLQRLLGFRVVGQPHLQWLDHPEGSGRRVLEIAANAELQQFNLQLIVLLGDAGAPAEIADGVGRDAAAAQAGQGG